MSKIGFRIFELFVLMRYLLCLMLCYLFHIKKDVWLISERGTDARDNGYQFYKYMKEKHPEIKIKYVISKKSADYKKIEQKDVVNYRSFGHYIYFITSKFLISAHIMGCSPETRLFVRLDMHNLVKVRGRNVFLQHGVIYNKDYTRDNKQRFNLDLFICGAKPEYEYLLEKSYFGNNIIKLTGLARYDNYFDNKSEKYILVMPTWRYNISEIKTIEDFAKTKYATSWNDLINDKELIAMLEEKGLKLIFYPHYEFQKYIAAFESDSKNIIIADFEHYDVNVLLKNCSMLVTDFSSIFFDVHYMRKPVLYYQFDDEDFRKYHHEEGWYNFRDGFGYRAVDKSEATKYLIKKIEDGFKLEEKYRERLKKCFPHYDKKNCERIYNEIKRLDDAC